MACGTSARAGVDVDVVVQTRGAAVRKHRDRLQVRADGQEHEFAIDDVDQVVLGPGVSITSDALLLACEHGTDVVLTDWRDAPKGRVLNGSLMGAALTKRNQFAALEDPRGALIATRIVLAKCRSQANLLSRADRLRERPEVSAAIDAIRRELDAFDDRGRMLPELRSPLFGLEGSIGRHYLAGYRALLPEELGFQARTRRPPTDLINAALSYGYGIVHSQVERALYLVGLEPAAGFLHTDRWGRASLSLDVMELFRQALVDRAVLTLARREQFDVDLHAEEHGDGVLLSEHGRRLVAGHVLERLDDHLTVRGVELSWKQLIFSECRALASYLLGHRPDFRPYVHRWA